MELKESELKNRAATHDMSATAQAVLVYVIAQFTVVLGINSTSNAT